MITILSLDLRKHSGHTQFLHSWVLMDGVSLMPDGPTLQMTDFEFNTSKHLNAQQLYNRPKII